MKRIIGAPAGHANAQVKQLEVGEESAGQRLDNFLLRELKGAPKSLVYRILRKGEVRVNKGRAKPEQKLAQGDWIDVRIFLPLSMILPTALAMAAPPTTAEREP